MVSFSQQYVQAINRSNFATNNNKKIISASCVLFECLSTTYLSAAQWAGEADQLEYRCCSCLQPALTLLDRCIPNFSFKIFFIYLLFRYLKGRNRKGRERSFMFWFTSNAKNSLKCSKPKPGEWNIIWVSCGCGRNPSAVVSQDGFQDALVGCWKWERMEQATELCQMFAPIF